MRQLFLLVASSAPSVCHAVGVPFAGALLRAFPAWHCATSPQSCVQTTYTISYSAQELLVIFLAPWQSPCYSCQNVGGCRTAIPCLEFCIAWSLYSKSCMRLFQRSYASCHQMRVGRLNGHKCAAGNGCFSQLEEGERAPRRPAGKLLLVSGRASTEQSGTTQ